MMGEFIEKRINDIVDLKTRQIQKLEDDNKKLKLENKKLKLENKKLEENKKC